MQGCGQALEDKNERDSLEHITLRVGMYHNILCYIGMNETVQQYTKRKSHTLRAKHAGV